MSIVRSLLLFILAALAEIGGAWLVWQSLREHRGLVWVGAGIAALGAYGFVATLQDDNKFGRILAAYGGIFVASKEEGAGGHDESAEAGSAEGEGEGAGPGHAEVGEEEKLLPTRSDRGRSRLPSACE